MRKIILIHRIVANFFCKIGRLKWPRLLVVMLAILLASGCEPSPYDVEPGTATPPSKAVQTPLAQPSPTIRSSAAPSTFDDFLEEAFFAQITRDPELISELGLAQVFGMDHSQLTNVSDAFQLETYQLLQTQLDTLHSYDRALLTTDQQLSYDLFEWYLDDLLRGQEWRFYDYPVNQTLGIQNILIEFMTDRHPVRDLQGAQDYIHRLEQFTTKFDQLIEWLKIQEAQGIIPPKFVIQRVLSQLNWYLSQDPEETALYSALEERVLPNSSINPEQGSILFNDALRAIEEHVLPAYRDLRTYFEHLEDIADTLRLLAAPPHNIGYDRRGNPPIRPAGNRSNPDRD